jgi:quinol monooxygenase YgiN
MVLATTTFEDYARFMEVFTTIGAEKRKEHGCKGAHIFRDPNDADRIWAVFDWDEEGWKSFVSDPSVPPIMQQAGHKGRPQTATFDVHLDS